MRISTALATTIVTVSSAVLAANYAITNQQGEVLLLEPGDVGSTPKETTDSLSTASPAPTNATASDQTASQAPAPGESQSAAPAEPAPTQSTAPTPVTAVALSDPITYKYGVVQLELEKTDGTLTDIRLVQADATKGRDGVYQTLIDVTLQVQGTSYGNISGATFTVDAFKKAVDNALTKF